jgi:hypothetical protein
MSIFFSSALFVSGESAPIEKDIIFFFCTGVNGKLIKCVGFFSSAQFGCSAQVEKGNVQVMKILLHWIYFFCIMSFASHCMIIFLTHYVL